MIGYPRLRCHAERRPNEAIAPCIILGKASSPGWRNGVTAAKPDGSVPRYLRGCFRDRVCVDRDTAPGRPRWRVGLFHSRLRKPGTWIADHDQSTHRLRLSDGLQADHGETPAARAARSQPASRRRPNHPEVTGLSSSATGSGQFDCHDYVRAELNFFKCKCICISAQPQDNPRVHRLLQGRRHNNLTFESVGGGTDSQATQNVHALFRDSGYSSRLKAKYGTMKKGSHMHNSSNRSIRLEKRPCERDRASLDP